MCKWNYRNQKQNEIQTKPWINRITIFVVYCLINFTFFLFSNSIQKIQSNLIYDVLNSNCYFIVVWWAKIRTRFIKCIVRMKNIMIMKICYLLSVIANIIDNKTNKKFIQINFFFYNFRNIVDFSLKIISKFSNLIFFFSCYLTFFFFFNEGRDENKYKFK